MQLNFEIIEQVGQGNYPDIIHFANTQAQVFSLFSGELLGVPTDKIGNGEWENATFQESLKVSPDENMSHFQIDVLPGFGIIGGYKTGNIHKLIIYEYAFEMDRYLNSGSIKHSLDNPISSFNLSLENPDIGDPEHPGNIAINEENSLLSPGAKVRFLFGVGDDEAEFEMGTFYVDRGNMTLLTETANVDGRNKIGKILKEQSVDEINEFWLQPISKTQEELLLNANLTKDEFIIEPVSKEYWFKFAPDTPYYSAIEKTFEVLPGHKMRELADGTIVIGSENYSGFNSNGVYVFNRGKDIFSRQITRDDGEVYRRICVHTKDYSIVEYRDIQNYQSWNLQANKTLYIQVAEGSSPDDVKNYADEVESRMSNVGKVESFTGPFRPHLQVGDGAIIVDDKSNNLGIITEVNHQFGKSGFYTNFTVDSGGSIGKGRLSDYIKKIAVGSGGGETKIGWNDIDTDEYVNIAKHSKITVSSTINPVYHAGRINDGYMYYEEGGKEDGDMGWMPDKNDTSPYFKVDFGQRCIVDKIKLYLSYDETFQTLTFPEYYKVQYWNSAFWVDLLEVNSGITYEMTHEFAAIETSALRFILKQKATGRQNWREVEIWGNM